MVQTDSATGCACAPWSAETKPSHWIPELELAPVGSHLRPPNPVRAGNHAAVLLRDALRLTLRSGAARSTLVRQHRRKPRSYQLVVPLLMACACPPFVC